MANHEKKEKEKAVYVPLEGKYFNENKFFRLVKKQREREDVAALHYAPSIEILLCKGVKGQVSIGSDTFSVETKDVFFIAPNVVHSTIFAPGSGEIYVFQLSLEQLKQYLDVEKLLMSKGRTVFDIPCRISEVFDEIYSIIFNGIYAQRQEKIVCMSGICELFSLLEKTVVIGGTGVVEKADEKIRKIIIWTKENYAEDITIEQAAKEVFLSKYYFCRYFKEKTGITYMRYLNELRISKAIEMIKAGIDATDSCFACGFNNLSFFIKKFKEVTGYTTTAYKKLLLNYPETGLDNKK